MSIPEGTTFAEKHAAGTSIDSRIEDCVSARQKDNAVPCAVAFEIAKQLNVPARQVGITIDLMNLKLVKCQLGLFGYADGKKLNPGSASDEALNRAILSAAVDSRLICEKAWEIADQLKVGKISVGSACEKLRIKIKQCQLGAF